MAHDTEKQLQIWREDQERGGGGKQTPASI